VGFLAGLLATGAGAQQQRATNYQEALKQQESLRNFHELQRQFEARQAADERQAAIRNRTLALQERATQGEVDQQSRNRAFEGALQLPATWNRMNDAQKIAYYQQRENAAQRTGDQDVVTRTAADIAAIPKAYAETARGFNLYAQPGIAHDRIAAQEQMLDKRLGAQKGNVLAQIASRQELAGMSADVRMAVARYAAGAALQRTELSQAGAMDRTKLTQGGADRRAIENNIGRLISSITADDLRAAAANAQNEVRLRTSPTTPEGYTAPQVAAPDPNAAIGSYLRDLAAVSGGGGQRPPVTINVGGSDPNALLQLLNRNKGGTTPPAAKPPTGLSKSFQDSENALKRGAKLAAVVRHAESDPNLSPAERNMLIAELKRRHGGTPAPAPSRTPGPQASGGSAATPPFSPFANFWR